MPHPIAYSGGQDDDQTRAIDVVHIEPSIREGVHLVSSLYGSDASSPIRRYAPYNTVLPSISGPQRIPGTLVCDFGQWDSSPSAEFSYQWIADGADIPGANSQTWETSVEFDMTTITCEVRADNGRGEAYAYSSNEIYISLVEPIEVNDGDFSAISGLELSKKQINHGERIAITSGIGADFRLDVNRGVAYFFTGRSADLRNDMNSMFLDVITGLHSSEHLTVFNDEGPAVISYELGHPLDEEPVQLMPLKNPEAEIGTAGWEIFGAANYRSGTNFKTRSHINNYSWFGGENVAANQQNIPYSFMSQEVEIYPIWQSDVDASFCFVELSWYQSSETWDDLANVKVEFLAANGDVIALDDGPGFMAAREDLWLYRYFDAPIPPNTKKVKVYLEFNLQDGSTNDAMIDYVVMKIRKGDKITDRSYGPDFEKWRLYFTQANTYSGIALSELEFRETSGGTNLATGGFPLVGSEGIGGLGIYAYDGLRNTGYWAGELNAVANGSAWLGYDMGIPVRPQEIDITARSGSNSLQVGTSFMLQGSDDGIRWTNVQSFNDIGTFTSAQQRQFEILFGSYDWWAETSLTSAFSKGTSTTVYPTKGHIFRSKARMNISHLQAHLDTGVIPTFSIFKVNFQKSRGMIVGPIVQVTAPETTSLDWVEVALPEDFELEVDEYFAIVASDFTLPLGNLPLSYYINVDEDSGSYNIFNSPMVSRYGSWIGTESSLTISEENSNTAHGYYCVDFKGSIF